ncbi:DUF11 domain-containing protein [Deinococcus hohokamensis]|uniref:DUF11 domain-containing protein n=1 Tax=Deinococcus hohokamensis TaxID=309883 RepID=A0ABV9I735_9DEIO
MRISTLLSPLTAALLTLTGAAPALGTPAGTQITNVASAEAQGAENGQTFYVTSNAISTEVRPVCAVNVTPDGTVQQPARTITVSSGERALFPYKVVNTGNAAFALNLGTRQEDGSTLTLAASDLRVFRDANANGVLDADEREVSSLTLRADEAADLLLEARTARTARGVVYATLLAACGAADGGARDENNTVALNVQGLASLGLSKTMTPAQAKPGDLVDVTVRAENTGNADASALTITDLLNSADLAGLQYVPGSAAVPAGSLEYTSDGAVWQATETAPVRGVRWNLATLKEGGAGELRFKMRVEAQAALGVRRNTARLSSASGVVTEASASVTIGAGPRIALGPVNHPEAPELGNEDQQTRSGALLGQPSCFEQTLQNTGNVTDQITVRPSVSAGTADVALLDLTGAPLQQPVTLAPGERLSFRVCLTPRSGEDVRLVLTASSAAGAADNSTVDQLSGIDARPATVALPLVKRVAPEGAVQAGAILTYTLSARNNYAFDLTNVTVTDTLSPAVVFVGADLGGQASAGKVTWRLDRLAAGQEARLTLTVRVLEGTKDGTAIANQFELSSAQTPNAAASNTVVTPVWSAALTLQKSVSPEQATTGDRLTYTLRAVNTSAAAPLRDLTITDALPTGLVYIPGSSRLNGAPTPDPVAEQGRLTWTVPTLAEQATATITFDARVTPEAGDDILNTASAHALGVAGNAVAAVASNTARATVRLNRSLFGSAQHVLIGRVFVDRNDNGVYDGTDTPVGRARVLLADGRTALTDAEGRYHFANVTGGTVALRLDPNSVPYLPRPMPQDGGLRGTRGVLVSGLTSADFPLQPLQGGVSALTCTCAEFRYGDLTLSKTVTRDQDGYTVTLILRAPREVADLTLTDALPQGARLLSGTPVLSLGTLPAGERTLTYRYAVPAAPTPGVLTQPTLRWRLP